MGIFRGGGIFQGGVCWVGIFRVGIFPGGDFPKTSFIDSILMPHCNKYMNSYFAPKIIRKWLVNTDEINCQKQKENRFGLNQINKRRFSPGDKER